MSTCIALYTTNKNKVSRCEYSFIKILNHYFSSDKLCHFCYRSCLNHSYLKLVLNISYEEKLKFNLTLGNGNLFLSQLRTLHVHHNSGLFKWDNQKSFPPLPQFKVVALATFWHKREGIFRIVNLQII